ncbi:TraI domain-containing protein [Crenobacter sp. SG2305]|uniref:TraI domain-containing protein n=1 Tax=Crenobacter oryzisoli TaxID=3056844 RepID=UPI0025AA43DB|nr:TraI domain-containing protein [Crenobacter sp. SG2305]MDN0082496.1 TraI domain-containing protein [Crenobacter sp. SG2305]
MNWLNRLLPRGATPAKRAPDSAKAQTPPKTSAAPVMHAYPSVDSGYPATTAQGVLHELGELVQRVCVTVTPDRYRLHYQPAVEALAGWTLNLPLTESGLFMTPAGMIRCALETAFHCQRMAEQSLFAASEPVERRQEIEQRWCVAAFMSGLFAEISALTTMTVVSPNGETWACFTHSLESFLREQAADRFYLSFKPSSPNTAMSSTLAQRILSPELIQYLHDGHPSILPTLLAAIDGKANPASPRLLEVLQKAKAGVAHQEKLRQPQNYGRVRQGTHLEPYLLDGLRSLVPGWQINAPSGPVWNTADGMFLEKSVLTQLTEFLRGKDIPAIPSSIETLAELLFAVKVLDQTQEGRLFWSVYPLDQSPRDAVKLANPEMLYGWSAPGEKIGSILKPPKQRKVPANEGDNADLFEQAETIATQPAEASNPEPIEPAIETEADSVTAPPASAAPEAAPQPEDAPVTTNEPVVELVATAKPKPDQPKRRRNPEEAGQTRPTQAGNPAVAEPKAFSPPPATTGKQNKAPAIVDTDNAADAIPVELRLSEHAESLLRQTHDAAISEFLRALITDFVPGKSIGMKWCKYGFAIQRGLLPRYGMDELTLFNKLHGCGWLAQNPDKPGQKFLVIDFPDGKDRALVLKPIIAVDLGIPRNEAE